MVWRLKKIIKPFTYCILVLVIDYMGQSSPKMALTHKEQGRNYSSFQHSTNGCKFAFIVSCSGFGDQVWASGCYNVEPNSFLYSSAISFSFQPLTFGTEASNDASAVSSLNYLVSHVCGTAEWQ